MNGSDRPAPLSSGLAILVCALIVGACEDSMQPVVEGNDVSPELSEGTAPVGVIEVAMGATAISLWPYTGTDVSGAISDPINLLFPGHDVRDVRTVLLALDGNRTAFGMPPVAPFNCVWSDAIGANQSSYNAESGWQGSAIQLECGDYAPMRFHVRLFEAGDGTAGNAHFEVIIPGTNQHEVLSWELAEQIVTVDMLRAGLLSAAPGASEPLNPAPTFKTINPLIYNGLPVALRGLIGGPLANVGAPVPIPSNGRATVFMLGAVPAPTPMDVTERTVLQFGQVIPKPFCATGPADYVYATGPIDFVHRVVVTAEGEYSADFEADGVLRVTPVNPLTGQPTAPSIDASVKALYTNRASEYGSKATNRDRQVLGYGEFAQILDSRFSAGRGFDHASVDVRCN